MAQAPDMSIFGPFGGELVKGGPDFWAQQKRLSERLFHGGSGTCELVKAIASGNLLVLIMLERNQVKFEGHTEPHPWVLRTTQVFRRDGDRWLRLHRHADPLIDRHSVDETLALFKTY